MRRFSPVLLLLALSAAAQTWTQLPDFPGIARDDAASFFIDQDIYVGTGMDEGFQLTNDWYKFNTTTEQWSAVASMPCSPRQYCTGFNDGSVGYVFGGVDGTGSLNELWAYDPALDTWVQKASMPAAGRSACVATCLYTGCYVATGMLSNGVPTNEMWYYDPDSDDWSARSPVPGPPRHRAAATDDGGGLMVVGGADSAFTALRDVWSYPIWFETGDWYPRDSLPQPRYGADGGGSYGPFVVAGATDNATFHDDLWEYDNNTWSAITPFAGGTRRGGVSASLFVQWPWVNLYYGLGLDNTFQRKRDWWRLDHVVGAHEITGHQWFTLGPIPADGSLHLQSPCGPDAEMMITDAFGRMVLQQRVSATMEVNTSAIPAGSYVLTLRCEQRRGSRRFVVIH